MSTIARKYNHTHIHPLTTARIAHGWSQAHLAELLGVSTRTVVRWELGQTLPYPIYREQLCRLLGLDLADLGLLPQQSTPDDNKSALEYIPSSETPVVHDPMLPATPGLVDRLQGRHLLLQQIRQSLLSDHGPTSIALRGLPGVGKTAIAMALATDPQVQAYFSDGILWAQMGPQADVLELLAHWGAVLGLNEDDLDDTFHSSAWERSLHTSIGQRRMLLVIDDAWSTEAALALQVGGPHCVHLLTTRLPHVAFGFAQERTIVVPELGEADSLTVLEHFVPELIEQEELATRALVRMTGGLPLALNLLGKYLAMNALMGQPRRLKTALSHLLERQHRMQVSLPLSLSERAFGLAWQPSLSLQAAIDLSVEHLNPEERADLLALALFPAKPNSFAEEAALAVTGGSVERLDALWDIGLLESSGPGRYMLHQTIVDYARELGTDLTVWQRLGSWVVDLVCKHRHNYALLEQEWTTIETYLEGSDESGKSEPEQSTVHQTIICLQEFLQARGEGYPCACRGR